MTRALAALVVATIAACGTRPVREARAYANQLVGKVKP